MALASEIVDQAMRSLGILTELTPVDEFLQEQFFDALIRMINRWSSIGINLGIAIPSTPSDDLENPEGVEDALIASLAIAGQKIAKVTASGALRKDQKIYYREMKAAFGLTPEQAYPSSLPVGQGLRQQPRSKRFFPETDTVGSNTDTAIAT